MPKEEKYWREVYTRPTVYHELIEKSEGKKDFDWSSSSPDGTSSANVVGFDDLPQEVKMAVFEWMKVVTLKVKGICLKVEVSAEESVHDILDKIEKERDARRLAEFRAKIREEFGQPLIWDQMLPMATANSAFMDPPNFVMRKGIRSKVCPKCSSHFRKIDGGFSCVECGFRLDNNGEAFPVYYGTIRVEDKKEDGDE